MQITKLFGTNAVPGDPDNRRISRGSVSADSNDLENNIADNCSVAPSYSEAMLMHAALSQQHRSHSNTSNNNSTLVPCSNGVTRPPTPASSVVPQFPRITTTVPVVAASSGPISHQLAFYYRPAPLPLHRPDDPYQAASAGACPLNSQHRQAPPAYEEALQLPEPVDVVVTLDERQMRRSVTERDFRDSKWSAARLLLPRRSFNYSRRENLL